MPRPRTLIALLAAALLAVALAWLLAARAAATPRISIGVLSYESSGGKGPGLFVRVGITNTGHTTISYNLINFSDARVWTESQDGWKPRDIGLPVLLHALLKPGLRTSTGVALPAGTLRWKVAYKVRDASLRWRVVESLPDQWRARLFPLCCRLLSDREGPEQEIQSGLFECPRNEPLAMDGWTPPTFGSDLPWPVLLESQR